MLTGVFILVLVGPPKSDRLKGRKVKNIDTKQSNKRNNQSSKDKTIT